MCRSPRDALFPGQARESLGLALACLASSRSLLLSGPAWNKGHRSGKVATPGCDWALPGFSHQPAEPPLAKALP